MSLKLQVSNSLSQLAKRLFKDLRNENTNVFQPNFIVTQTEGMNNWLKLQMASEMGIAANYRFLKPNDLVQEVYRLLSTQYTPTLSADNQSWILYKLLAEKEFVNKFSSISNYYNSQNSDKEIKRMALAEKVADLFDQYQIYRPEMIREWNKSNLDQVNSNEWQKYLWIRCKQVFGKEFLDKTLIGDKISDALDNPDNQRKLKDSMPAVHLFGLSITTDYHLELFYKIAKHIDISFHIINPAPAVYWFDDKTDKQIAKLKAKGFIDYTESEGNVLLSNWGSIIRDTFGLLFKNENLLNEYEEIEFDKPKTDTLLHKIQSDIFSNSLDADRENIFEANLKDSSITINSCFTPLREVEVLYNYLVHLVDTQKKQTISPREIVVMVSNIDAYVPYIKAIFDNANYKFPYTIADESFTSEDTLSGALKAVLSINKQNFKAETVLQLLEHRFIRNRFGINDLSLIRKVVSQANIRFGMEGNLADESVYLSWKYGLERIIYGICISGEEEYFGVEPSIFPLDMVEGADALSVISFCHFVKVLMDAINEREKNRDLNNWVTYVENLINNLIYEPSEETEEDYVLLEKQLSRYTELEGILDEVLTYEVFSRSFLKCLNGTTRTSTFVTGGITFCSLIPMRSIPFKIVALLGLDFDKFPRKENQIGFNLMEKKRKGDRNVKENDKHLFLETLLSAQENLYISYVGQSVKDNKPIPPSVLIDELLDYMQVGCKENINVAKAMVTQHPLQSFSRKYTEEKLLLYNYLNDKNSEVDKSVMQENIIEDFDFSKISLHKMISFFKNPFAGYYNNVLGIYYKSDNVLLDETEIFDLDGLQKWNLKNTLLWAEESKTEELRNKLVKTGQLPLKNMANVAILKVESEIKDVKKLFFDCKENAQKRSIPIEISINGSTITGVLEDVYDDKMIFICYSKNENKYLLDAYIKYLVSVVASLELSLHFVSFAKSEIFDCKEITKEDAEDRLIQLISLYKSGHSNILPYYLDLGLKQKEIDMMEDVETLLSKVESHINNYNFPCRDEYYINEYANGFYQQPNVLDNYKANAELLLRPLEALFPTYYDAN
jgi:exodeoxyribonuclease V gamma subunit